MNNLLIEVEENYNDKEIANINKINPIVKAIKKDSMRKQLNPNDIIITVLNNHYNTNTNDWTTLYKLLLHEAIDKQTTVLDIIINNLYNYYYDLMEVVIL